MKGTGRHTPPVPCQTPAPLHTPLKIASSPPFAGKQQYRIKTCTSMGQFLLHISHSHPRSRSLHQFRKSTPLPHVTRQRGGCAMPQTRLQHSWRGVKRGIGSSRFRPYCHRHLRDASPAWQSGRLFASPRNTMPFCHFGLSHAVTGKGWCYSVLNEEQVKHRNTNAQCSGSATQKVSCKAITLNDVQER